MFRSRNSSVQSISRIVVLFALCGALAMLPVGNAFAVTWSGGGTTDAWSDTGNWVGGATPVDTDNVLFSDADSGGTNLVDSTLTLNSLSYDLDPTNQAGFTHTTQIGAGQTLTATSLFSILSDDLDAATATANVTISGGAGAQLVVGGTSDADVLWGRNPDSGTSHGSLTVNLDMSALPTFTADVELFRIARGERNSGGTFTLAQNNSITADEFTVGYHSGSTSLTTTLNLGTTNQINSDNITFGGPKTNTLVQFQTGLVAPSLTLRGKSGTDRVDNLSIGNNAVGTSSSPVGELDVTAGSIDALVGTLLLGQKTDGLSGDGTGILRMAAGTLDATTIILGRTARDTADNHASGTIDLQGGAVVAGSLEMAVIGSLGTAAGTIDQSGGSMLVTGNVTTGGGTSNVNVDGGTFQVGGQATVVGGAFDITNLNVGATGPAGTFTMTGIAASQGTQSVETYTQGSAGTLKLLANGNGLGQITAATATVDGNVEIENQAVAGPSTAVADQTIWTGEAAAWDGSQDPWHRGGPAGWTISTNDDFTFLNATSLVDNGLSVTTADWSLDVDTIGGTATLTRTGADITSGPVRAVINSTAADVTRATDLTIAESAGADAAMLDISAGALTVGTPTTNANLILGGSAGQVFQSGGTITVNGNVVDNGDSTINLSGGAFVVHGNGTVDTALINGGDLTVNGDATVNDQLHIGRNGQTATMTVDGGDFVYTGTTLDIGRRTGDGFKTTTSGTLDASDATSFMANNLNELSLGRIDTGDGSNGSADGHLLLAAVSEITATTILVGDSPSEGNQNGPTTSITLGADTTFHVDTFYVGRRKTDAVVQFAAPGGVFHLDGKSGTRANLFVGYNDTNTGTTPSSTMDVRDGTFNAMVDQMVVGRHNQGGGFGSGTFSMNAGTLDANSILLAQVSVTGPSTNPQNTTGRFELEGGTLNAGTINQGGGTAQFVWTGGTLSVDTFGFDLVQQNTSAASALGPGDSIGQTEVQGDYTLAGGSWAMEVDATANTADKVLIAGLLDLSGTDDTLDISVLAGTVTNQTFVIAEYGSLLGQFDGENLFALPSGYYVDYHYQGENLIALTVPEPGSWALLLAAFAGLWLWRRRRS